MFYNCVIFVTLNKRKKKKGGGGGGNAILVQLTSMTYR